MNKAGDFATPRKDHHLSLCHRSLSSAPSLLCGRGSQVHGWAALLVRADLCQKARAAGSGHRELSLLSWLSCAFA